MRSSIAFFGICSVETIAKIANSAASQKTGTALRARPVCCELSRSARC